MSLLDFHPRNLPARRSAQREGGRASAMPSKRKSPVTAAKEVGHEG